MYCPPSTPPPLWRRELDIFGFPSKFPVFSESSLIWHVVFGAADLWLPSPGKKEIEAAFLGWKQGFSRGDSAALLSWLNIHVARSHLELNMHFGMGQRRPSPLFILISRDWRLIRLSLQWVKLHSLIFADCNTGYRWTLTGGLHMSANILLAKVHLLSG